MAESETRQPRRARGAAVKRAQVRAACQECRRRKARCDGQRPCNECRRRDETCVYTVHENETRRQGLQREYDELAQSHGRVMQLYQTLAGGDENLAQEVFARIRNGEQVRDLIREREEEQNALDFNAAPYEKEVYQKLLLLLAQSTAPLKTVVDIAALAHRHGTKITLPQTAMELVQIDRIVTLEYLSGLLDDYTPNLPTLINSDQHQFSPSTPLPDGSYSGPLYWVPAAPWTNQCASDESVSHLVSLFLTFINSYWRQVEEDLLIAAMRSKNRYSPYCSALLVNAILAVASQLSEIEAAFASPGHLITRGQHFHEEAVRLWTAEEGRASISNMQALLVLSLDSSLRGRDKLGLNLAEAAASMNKALPFPTLLPNSNHSLRHHERARCSIATSTVSMNIGYTLGLLLPPDSMTVSLDDARDPASFLSNTPIFWIGYPLYSETIPHWPNLLMRERWKLAGLTWQLIHLLFGPQCFERNKSDLYQESEALSAKADSWYRGLPTELRYYTSMPTSVYELHGHYQCFQMVLCSRTLEAISRPGDDDMSTPLDDSGANMEALAKQLRLTALKYAFVSTEILRDYRNRYGLKIVLSYLIQPATIAINLFLRLRGDQEIVNSNVPSEASSGINDFNSAFEECFRYLLASGMHQMLPRAIARMVWHTAKQLEVELPLLVRSTLDSLSDSAWHSSDVQTLNSVYPNYAMEENTLGEMLRKWEELPVEVES